MFITKGVGEMEDRVTDTIDNILNTIDENRLITINTLISNDADSDGCGGYLIEKLCKLGFDKTKKPICILLTSPGGDAFLGLAIGDLINVIKGLGTPVIIIGIGKIASAAAILFLSGTKRIMTKNAWLMFHEINFNLNGTITDMSLTLDLSKKVNLQTLNLITEKSNLSFEEVNNRCTLKDWWIDASSAFELGLIDRII